MSELLKKLQRFVDPPGQSHDFIGSKCCRCGKPAPSAIPAEVLQTEQKRYRGEEAMTDPAPTPRFDYWKRQMEGIGAWDHALVAVPAKPVQEIVEELKVLERALRAVETERDQLRRK